MYICQPHGVSMECLGVGDSVGLHLNHLKNRKNPNRVNNWSPTEQGTRLMARHIAPWHYGIRAPWVLDVKPIPRAAWEVHRNPGLGSFEVLTPSLCIPKHP